MLRQIETKLILLLPSKFLVPVSPNHFKNTNNAATHYLDTYYTHIYKWVRRGRKSRSWDHAEGHAEGQGLCSLTRSESPRQQDYRSATAPDREPCAKWYWSYPGSENLKRKRVEKNTDSRLPHWYSLRWLPVKCLVGAMWYEHGQANALAGGRTKRKYRQKSH